MGEVKNNKVAGFHNWLSFLKEEGEGDLDYKGYIKKLDLQNKVSKHNGIKQFLVFIIEVHVEVSYNYSQIITSHNIT